MTNWLEARWAGRLAGGVLLMAVAGLSACGDAPAASIDVGFDASADAPVVEDEDQSEVGQPVPLDDGEACASNAECSSERCMTEADGFPDGFCTTFDCTGREDCQGIGRACLRGEFNGNLCVALCASDGDCRTGYECRGSSVGGYCYPAFAPSALNPSCDSQLIDEDAINSPFFDTMDRHRLSFEVSEGASSFAVVLYSRSDPVLPELMTTPSGKELGLIDQYGFFTTTGLILERIAPVMIPAGPDWLEWVEPGTYTLDVGTTGDEVCWFVLENLGPGHHIDLNFYFVGVPGLNARSADSDPDFAEMLESFEATMGLANISLGQVRYFDVTGDIEDAFGVIRSNSEVYELMTLSRAPGQALEDLLSVDVFFVQDFAGAMFSTLGVAPGIPGVMGVHGQEGTGLIFSASNLGSGDGNRLVGQVLAHELGHFLGLAHTSEIAAEGLFDWLDDTPECPDIRSERLENCPDFDNLMFPIASFRDEVVLSEGQKLILRSNPAVRPE